MFLVLLLTAICGLELVWANAPIKVGVFQNKPVGYFEDGPTGIVFSPFAAYYAVPKSGGNQAVLDKIDEHVRKMKADPGSIFYTFPEQMRIRPDMPTILCTGFSEKMSPEKAAALGIRGYLMKPIVKTELAVEIRKALAA